MTRRAQILLEDWQLEALRSAAEREGTSISGLVRKIVSDYLAQGSGDHQAPRGVDDIAGLVDDAEATARDHDRLLYQDAKERGPE